MNETALIGLIGSGLVVVGGALVAFANGLFLRVVEREKMALARKTEDDRASQAKEKTTLEILQEQVKTAAINFQTMVRRVGDLEEQVNNLRSDLATAQSENVRLERVVSTQELKIGAQAVEINTLKTHILENEKEHTRAKGERDQARERARKIVAANRVLALECRRLKTQVMTFTSPHVTVIAEGVEKEPEPNEDGIERDN